MFALLLSDVAFMPLRKVLLVLKRLAIHIGAFNQINLCTKTRVICGTLTWKILAVVPKLGFNLGLMGKK